MKIFKYYSLLFLLTLSTVALFAQNPNEQKQPSIPEMAASEADNLTKLFDLEYYQTYLVDSILQANMEPMMAELDNVKQSGASNQESYMTVSDKWLDKIDSAFQKIFTEEQWKRYMKSNYGKEKKKRDKRIAKRNKSTK